MQMEAEFGKRQERTKTQSCLQHQELSQLVGLGVADGFESQCTPDIGTRNARG